METQNEIEINKLKHKEVFEKFLNDFYKADTTTFIINQEKHDEIVRYLKNEVSKPNPCFKHYVKKYKFSLQLDDNKVVLYRCKKNINLPVAIKENFFDILYNIHSVRQGHVGINKVEHQLKLRYHDLKRRCVKEFIRLYSICNLKSVLISVFH